MNNSDSRLADVEQSEGWAGEQGHAWALHFEQHDRMVATLTPKR